MSNHVVMLFYIYTLKLNETYLIPLHVHGVQKKNPYDINNNSCLKKIIVYNLSVILRRYKVTLRTLIEIDFLL